jgi:GGDEF domain-containing protein
MAAARLAVVLVRVDPRVMLVLPGAACSSCSRRTRPGSAAGTSGSPARPARGHPIAGRPGRAGRAGPGHRRSDPAVQRRPGRGRAADGRLVRGNEHGVDYDGPAAEAADDDDDAIVERPIGSDARPARDAATPLRRPRLAQRPGAGDARRGRRPSCTPRWSRRPARRPRQHEATHDPLTKLLNRAGLQVRGRAALAETAAARVDAAMLLIDISGFRRSSTRSGTPPVTPSWCTPPAGWPTRCCPASWWPGWRATSSPSCCRS